MGKSTCSVDDCPRSARCKGWCAGHWTRVKRHGDPQAHIPFRVAPTPGGAKCSLDDCPRDLRGEGLCGTHLYRKRKTGDAMAHVPVRPVVTLTPVCVIDECGKPHEARGWCRRHYIRWYKHGDPTICLYGHPPTACAVGDCDNPSQSLGWCRTHYSRWQCWGDVRADLPVLPRWAADDVCVVDDCGQAVKTRGRCRKHYGQLYASELMGDPVRRRKLLANHRRWAARAKARNPERFRAQMRAWRSRNPNAARWHDHKKRQRRMGAPTIPFTAQQLDARMRYWGNRCWICRGPFEAVDHVKPLAKGGWHALMNLRPACRPCNSSKKDKWPFPVGA